MNDKPLQKTDPLPPRKASALIPVCNNEKRLKNNCLRPLQKSARKAGWINQLLAPRAVYAASSTTEEGLVGRAAVNHGELAIRHLTNRNGRN